MLMDSYPKTMKTRKKQAVAQKKQIP